MYPVLLQFGSLGLRTFPLVLAAAVLLGGKLAAAELRRRNLDPDPAHDMLVPTALLGLAGARLLYVLLFDPGWYVAHPGDVLALWTGGLAFPGALLAGLGTVLWGCRRRGILFWPFTDSAVPGLALGQAIGAVGSFLNGTSYGTPTDARWAVVFTDSRGQAPLGIPMHPTQLYEALAGVVLFAGLWVVGRRRHREGALFLVYLAGASALALLDLLKGDALWIADTVPAGSVVTLVMLAVAAVPWSRRQFPLSAPADAPASPAATHGDSGEGQGPDSARSAFFR